MRPSTGAESLETANGWDWSHPKSVREILRARTPAPRAVAIGVVLLSAVLTLTGCLSKPALRREVFLVSPPAVSTNAPNRKFSEGIQLRPVSVAAPFAGRSLVYRLSDTAYEVDPYAQFLVAPDRMLDAAIRQWCRQSGIFREVLGPESPGPSGYWGEIHVSEFYGDLRPGRTPVASIALQFTLITRRQGSPLPGDVSTRQVARTVPLRERTAAAVADGLQQALGEALAELTKSF